MILLSECISEIPKKGTIGYRYRFSCEKVPNFIGHTKETLQKIEEKITPTSPNTYTSLCPPSFLHPVTPPSPDFSHSFLHFLNKPWSTEGKGSVADGDPNYKEAGRGHLKPPPTRSTAVMETQRKAGGKGSDLQTRTGGRGEKAKNAAKKTKQN